MTAGGAGGGVSGFEYSDDSVVAKVAVEVSSTDLDSLRQLSDRTDTLRAGLEAVARSQGDFNTYLQQLPEIQQRATTAQQAYLDVLKATVEQQEKLRLSSGSSGAGGGTLGQPDPFVGALAGMGGVPAGGAAVPQNLAQAAQGLGQLAQADPRAAGAWNAAHGMPTDRQSLAALYPSLRQQEEDTKAHVQNRAQQHAGGGPSSGSAAGQFKDVADNVSTAAQMVLNETHPGGSLMRLGARAMSGAAHMLGGRSGSPATGDGAPGDLGGGGGRPGSEGPMDALGGGILDGLGLGKLGGLAKGFGMGSAALTGALAINRIVQNAGEDYQQYKNLGMMKGGGAAEGYGYEVQARIMALDPYISTEQSRQIIQAALRDGYTGKEYDTVTSFIASNIKDMNMTINESVQALHKSVETGGQSLEGFRAQMDALKEASKTGVRTYDDMKAAVEANTSIGVDQGMSGGAAGAFASANALAFKDNRVLANAGDRFAAAAMSSDTYLAEVGASAHLGDVMPGEVPYADPNFTKDAWLPIVEEARRLGTGRHAAEMFYQYVSRKLPQWGLTRAEAAAMLEYLQTQNPGEVGSKAAAEAASATHKKSRLERSGNILYSTGKEARDIVGSLNTVAEDILNPGKWKNLWGDIKAVPGKIAGAEAEASIKSADYDIPVLNEVIKQYGARGIELVGKDGKVIPLDLSNESTVKGLQNNEIGWRQKGTQGPGTTLANTAGTLQTSGAQGVQVAGTLTISLAPGAEKLISTPKTLTLTQNQLRAGAGYGGATMNGAPPGDR